MKTQIPIRGLQDYLYEIAEKSLAGEIEWNQSNPSTFQWTQTSQGEIFYVTIQKAGKPSVGRTIRETLMAQEDSIFLFQVVSKSSKQTAISLSSKERPELYDSLLRIYQSAEKNMDIRSASVLRRLLLD
jgi:hypothetical protein